MKEPIKETLRITGQYRTKNAMSYDLRSPAGRITLRVTPRELPSDLAEWRVDAAMDKNSESVVTGWGATRTEALGEVARSWVGPTHTALPTFDWTAIEVALNSVRAL